MDRNVATNRREAHHKPRLITTPTGWTKEEANRWLNAVAKTWSLLRSRAARYLDQTGWRDLGLTVVQVETPGFRQLATEYCATWAALDTVDQWKQTIVAVARRAPHWQSPIARCVLAALDTSKFDIYRVHRGSSEVVLRRLRTGEELALSAVLDAGGYPDGGFVVARVVEIGQLKVSLSSVTVDPRAVRAEAGAYKKRPLHWAERWFRIGLKRLIRVVQASGNDVTEARLDSIAPAAIGRLGRAFDAFVEATKVRSAVIHHKRFDDFSVHFADGPHGLEVNVIFGDIGYRIARRPSTSCAAIDTEMSAQAGLTSGAAVLLIERLEMNATPVRTREVDRAVRALAKAALAFGASDQVAA